MSNKKNIFSSNTNIILYFNTKPQNLQMVCIKYLIKLLLCFLLNMIFLIKFF